MARKLCPVCDSPLERRHMSKQWWCPSCGWTEQKEKKKNKALIEAIQKGE